MLSWLHRESGGRTLEANRALVADNAGLAAEIAVAATKEMKWVLACRSSLPSAGASPLPGLPGYTAGYTSWTKLNSKPIPRRAVDAHSSIKNVYVSKLPRAGRYPGRNGDRQGRAAARGRSGHADRRDAEAPRDRDRTTAGR